MNPHQSAYLVLLFIALLTALPVLFPIGLLSDQYHHGLTSVKQLHERIG